MELILLTLIAAVVVGCIVSEEKGLTYGFIIFGVFWSLVLLGYLINWLGLIE